MGRIFGVAIIVAIQAINGAIHVPSGLVLFFADLIGTSFLPIPNLSMSSFLLKTYGLYTFFYGLLTLVFAYGLWITKRWGWIGTAATCVFVIVVDVLTVLNLSIIPGVPSFAGIVEIPFSFAVLAYILQPHVRRAFLNTGT
jgi:uncharacterized membrane protein (DUF2068 family)